MTRSFVMLSAVVVSLCTAVYYLIPYLTAEVLRKGELVAQENVKHIEQAYAHALVFVDERSAEDMTAREQLRLLTEVIDSLRAADCRDRGSGFVNGMPEFSGYEVWRNDSVAVFFEINRICPVCPFSYDVLLVPVFVTDSGVQRGPIEEYQRSFDMDANETDRRIRKEVGGR